MGQYTNTYIHLKQINFDILAIQNKIKMMLNLNDILSNKVLLQAAVEIYE